MGWCGADGITRISLFAGCVEHINFNFAIFIRDVSGHYGQSIGHLSLDRSNAY